jgi:tRNA G46 methylase TrmB
LSIFLAFFHPELQFVLIDIERKSIYQAKYRAEKLGLKNIECIIGDINNYN